MTPSLQNLNPCLQRRIHVTKDLGHNFFCLSRLGPGLELYEAFGKGVAG